MVSVMYDNIHDCLACKAMYNPQHALCTGYHPGYACGQVHLVSMLVQTCSMLSSSTDKRMTLLWQACALRVVADLHVSNIRCAYVCLRGVTIAAGAAFLRYRIICRVQATVHYWSLS